MREILQYCGDGEEKKIAAGGILIHEGTSTGRLFILVEGRLEVIRRDTVVAVIAEPGAILGEMSLLLHQPHTATVRAAADSVVCEMPDARKFLDQRPAVAMLIAQLLARRLYAATTYLADLKQQYAGHGNHLEMVSEVLQSMINLTPGNVQPGSDLHSDPRV